MEDRYSAAAIHRPLADARQAFSASIWRRNTEHFHAALRFHRFSTHLRSGKLEVRRSRNSTGHPCPSKRRRQPCAALRLWSTAWTSRVL
jgi:hypothetical protein